MHTLLLLFAFGALAAAQNNVIVKIDTGLIMGVADYATGAQYFKGIPYAGSAAGLNRWLPPQPVLSWNGVKNTTTFGPGCPQTHHNPDVPSVQVSKIVLA